MSQVILIKRLGQTNHRLARLVAAGGGQRVVISEPTEGGDWSHGPARAVATLCARRDQEFVAAAGHASEYPWLGMSWKIRWLPHRLTTWLWIATPQDDLGTIFGSVTYRFGVADDGRLEVREVAPAET